MGVVNERHLHYDIVGSFLRPPALKQARKDYFKLHQISHEQLTKIENQAIAELVTKEIKTGLKVVTDGEFRRSYWHLDTFWGFNGIQHTKQKHGYLFHDEETRNDSVQVTGKISFNPNHPDVKAYQYLYQLVKKHPGVIIRQSIPAPAQLYVELICGQANQAALHKYYHSFAALVQDIGKAYHDLILALYDIGCRDVKLDDCTWMINNPAGNAVNTGNEIKFERLEQNYLKLNNAAIKNLPDDLRISTHVCRGNYDSTWASAGGYESVAKYVLAQEKVDAFYLEYDDARSGGFEPLAQVPSNKKIVLGLVTSKRPQLETSLQLIQRIHNAAKYHPINRLALSTQCGFASTEEGNRLTEAQE